MIYRAQTSHIGSNFGVADIMAVLFKYMDMDKDKFVLSAGWKAAMLYYHLWKKKKITKKELDSYCQEGSKFIGLAEPVIPEIIFAGGSMGLGISAATALAWSKKARKQTGRVYVLESDGGMQVGINWEALWFAAQHKLDNLHLIIDNNGFQAMGKTQEILSSLKIKEKLESFGWYVVEINGHDFAELDWAFRQMFLDKPMAIIANTTKGKGVSFMENNNLWHYAQIKDEDYKKAMEELCQK